MIITGNNSWRLLCLLSVLIFLRYSQPWHRIDDARRLASSIHLGCWLLLLHFVWADDARKTCGVCSIVVKGGELFQNEQPGSDEIMGPLRTTSCLPITTYRRVLEYRRIVCVSCYYDRPRIEEVAVKFSPMLWTTFKVSELRSSARGRSLVGDQSNFGTMIQRRKSHAGGNHEGALIGSWGYLNKKLPSIELPWRLLVLSWRFFGSERHR